ncbi:nucleoside-diphosphate kinase [Spirobacillus cienkowskii]|jgi:nucleoside-diphosphate kinase|uniref:Nucleoside diphosphate kinase n=1 Tax=Spirobacillus cienkowskii TaxID=495820 RepID=A0A369KWQ6_9BACT|nr:MAG: nucleoside-diphosphate kinase [Spirobacillus cienkowskii]
MEKTFSIIKPDGVKRNCIGKIFAKIEAADLKIVATKMIHMSKREAEQFYAVHSARPFFGELCDYMTSGPVVVSVLEGKNAVSSYRDLMGATDPAKAAKGTIRSEFGLSIGENTVHGSDSLENAAIEISYFFSGTELVNAAK